MCKISCPIKLLAVTQFHKQLYQTRTFCRLYYRSQCSLFLIESCQVIRFSSLIVSLLLGETFFSPVGRQRVGRMLLLSLLSHFSFLFSFFFLFIEIEAKRRRAEKNINTRNFYIQFTVDWISKRCHGGEAGNHGDRRRATVNVLIRFRKIVIQFLSEFRAKFQRKNIAYPMRSGRGFDLNFKNRGFAFCLNAAEKTSILPVRMFNYLIFGPKETHSTRPSYRLSEQKEEKKKRARRRGKNTRKRDQIRGKYSIAFNNISQRVWGGWAAERGRR